MYKLLPKSGQEPWVKYGEINFPCPHPKDVSLDDVPIGRCNKCFCFHAFFGEAATRNPIERINKTRHLKERNSNHLQPLKPIFAVGSMLGDFILTVLVTIRDIHWGIICVYCFCFVASFSKSKLCFLIFTYISYPIGSMYGIYANIWGILMVNVTMIMAYIRILWVSPCFVKLNLCPHWVDSCRHIPVFLHGVD